MLNCFEIHSALELSRTALLCCRLAASRLYEAARWQLATFHTVRQTNRLTYIPALHLYCIPGIWTSKNKSIELFTLKKAIGSYSNKDGDGYENVT